jgi:hypothetical protein
MMKVKKLLLGSIAIVAATGAIQTAHAQNPCIFDSYFRNHRDGCIAAAQTPEQRAFAAHQKAVARQIEEGTFGGPPIIENLLKDIQVKEQQRIAREQAQAAQEQAAAQAREQAAQQLAERNREALKVQQAAKAEWDAKEARELAERIAANPRPYDECAATVEEGYFAEHQRENCRAEDRAYKDRETTKRFAALDAQDKARGFEWWLPRDFNTFGTATTLNIVSIMTGAKTPLTESGDAKQPLDTGGCERAGTGTSVGLESPAAAVETLRRGVLSATLNTRIIDRGDDRVTVEINVHDTGPTRLADANVAGKTVVEFTTPKSEPGEPTRITWFKGREACEAALAAAVQAAADKATADARALDPYR